MELHLGCLKGQTRGGYPLDSIYGTSAVDPSGHVCQSSNINTSRQMEENRVLLRLIYMSIILATSILGEISHFPPFFGCFDPNRGIFTPIKKKQNLKKKSLYTVLFQYTD